jgi:hypothetical protein
VIFQEGSTGTKTITMDVTSFSIRLFGNASNTWGDQATATKTWSYNITQYGISGPL